MNKRKLFFWCMVIILSTFSIRSVLFGRNTIAKELSDNNLNNELALVDHESIFIDHDDDFISLGFTGNGTENNPYLIENLSLTDFTKPGMEIMFTTKFFEIRNCYINTPHYGIKLSSIANGTAKILNNVIDYSFAGIDVESTHNITLFNNSISENFYGIDISNSFNCNLSHNKFFESRRYGIRADNAKSILITHNYFYNSGVEIRNLSLPEYLECLIVDNFVEDKPLAFITNTVDAVISTPDYGQIILVNCTNLNISNQILNNGGIGFHLIYCEQIVLYNNLIYENYRGILIEESNKIRVENNIIESNALFGIEFFQSDYCHFANNIFYDQTTCIRLRES
ncbi:MAG: right-handed parallel beta-helix repeat-containing protein, partial [Candidatus Heimdallarchaeota archaeon]|nr:right-handed parallel beta-helix repeat-containing protein [Candidatus Heimdallarchaeota archaeon]